MGGEDGEPRPETGGAAPWLAPPSSPAPRAKLVGSTILPERLCRDALTPTPLRPAPSDAPSRRGPVGSTAASPVPHGTLLLCGHGSPASPTQSSPRAGHTHREPKLRPEEGKRWRLIPVPSPPCPRVPVAAGNGGSCTDPPGRPVAEGEGSKRCRFQSQRTRTAP